MHYRLAFYLATLILIGTACTNFKEVNRFSEEAQKGLSQFEKLDYNFRTYCLEQCRFESIADFEINRDPTCPCSDYEKADSTTQQLFQVIAMYWDGLFRLTNNQITQYDLSATAGYLENQDFGSVQLNTNQINAYQKLAEVILRAGTDGFRRKQVKKYIEAADADLNLLSEKLAFILEDNLFSLLSIKKEKWYGHYTNLSFSDNLSDYEKGLVVQSYYDKLDEIGKKQTKLAVMSQILVKIAEGHHELSMKNNEFSKADLRDWARAYSGEFKVLFTAFNQIND